MRTAVILFWAIVVVSLIALQGGLMLFSADRWAALQNWWYGRMGFDKRVDPKQFENITTKITGLVLLAGSGFLAYGVISKLLE